MAQAVVEDRVLLIRDAFEQIAVVGDDDEGARPGIEQILHGREHVRVDVVGRLVEDDDIGFGHEQKQQLQPALLAAREIAHSSREVLFGEAEPLEQLGGSVVLALDREARLRIGEDFADLASTQPRQVLELLIENADLHGLAALDASLIGLDLAGDEPEQGRLARSVRPEDPCALAGADPPGDIVEDRATVIALGHIEQIDDVLAQSGGRHLLQLDGVAHLGNVGDELVGGLDAELRLRGPGRSTSAQPGQLLAHEILTLLLGRCRDPITFDALKDVGRVSALEGFDDPIVDLPGLRAHLVEEPPIVGHKQQSPGVLRPPVLHMRRQPGDAVDVEVVRRLIEDEQVPVADQQGGQGHPASLSAGEAGDRGIPVEIGDESGDDVACLGIGRPFVVGHVTDDGEADARLGVEVVALAEHAQPQTTPVGHPPGIGIDGAGEHAQQARLAVAVAPDDADHVPGVDADGHGVEDDAGGVFEVQGFGPEKMCHNAL